MLRTPPQWVNTATSLVTGACAAVVACSAMLFTTGTPAQAQAPRTADAVGEIVAYYEHFLGRTPDSSGLNHYLLGAYADCRKGVTDAALAMANSGEAHTFLNANDRKTNAFYAGLLEPCRTTKVGTTRRPPWTTALRGTK